MTANKTLEESQLDNILLQLQQQHGDNFLLIITPDGNGNIALRNRAEGFTNILFNRLSTVLSPPMSKIH
ncbi:hypothetical protein [Vibrio fluvialis]|uniref:hypothetical protein n=1 Tax=Vibrio fluvialis TaxID=676 RepID=UPI001EEB5A93|nr:hypothetical protein [Vibrio fluvialis]MCG6391770.1 hypothetical protein [Vibrio fluvialis]